MGMLLRGPKQLDHRDPWAGIRRSILHEPGMANIKEVRKIKAHQDGDGEKSWQAKANDEADRYAKLGRLMRLHNPGTHACELEIQAHRPAAVAGLNQRLSAGGQAELAWNVAEQGHWYDLTVRAAQWPQWSCRFAGRMETGQDSMTDPAA